MNLHRSDKQPEWASVASAQRNYWQHLAATTKGVVTLGNLMTTIGLALVAGGLVALLHHHYVLAGSLLVVGRSCDLADGWLADITATKSPLGELLDAAADKVGTAATIVVLGVAGLTSWWVLAALLLPHVMITALAGAARRRQVRLQPSRLGKLSMAAAWIGLVGLVALAAFSTSAGWTAVVYGIIWLSVGMGLYTAATYGRTVVG